MLNAPIVAATGKLDSSLHDFTTKPLTQDHPNLVFMGFVFGYVHGMFADNPGNGMDVLHQLFALVWNPANIHHGRAMQVHENGPGGLHVGHFQWSMAERLMLYFDGWYHANHVQFQGEVVGFGDFHFHHLGYGNGQSWRLVRIDFYGDATMAGLQQAVNWAIH
jgi:hypothetical protein